MEEGQQKEKPKRKLSAAKELMILEKGARILDLRKNGVSLRAISAALIKEAEDAGRDTRGYSYSQVRKDYNALIHLKVEENDDAAGTIRVEIAEAIDDVILNFMPHVRTKIDISTQPNLVEMKKKAGDVVLKALNQKADLFGVKAPVKIANPDNSPIGKPIADAIDRFDKSVEKIYGDGDDPDSSAAGES